MTFKKLHCQYKKNITPAILHLKALPNTDKTNRPTKKKKTRKISRLRKMYFMSGREQEQVHYNLKHVKVAQEGRGVLSYI